MGIRESGKGTLTNGRDPGQVCNGDGKQARGGLRRRKCKKEFQAAGEEPCRGKSWLGKRKCTDVGPKHAGYSQRSGGKIYKTEKYFSRVGQYTQCRNKITGTTQGADGSKPGATEYSQGMKRNWRRYRNNGSTDSRAAARCREGKYRMVIAD